MLLEIAKGDPVQRFLDRIKESVGIGTVRTLSVSAPTMQPEFDQLLVRFGLPRDD